MPQHDQTIRYYHCNSRKTKVLQQIEEPWSKLASKLMAEVRGTETMEEWVEINKTDLGGVLKDKGGFVGGLLIDGQRGKGKVKARTLITLDADSVTTDIWSAWTMLNDSASLIYQTRSWQPDKPKLRLVIPLKEAIDPDLCTVIAKHIAKDIGMSNFDPTTFQSERIMYYPSISADAEHRPQIQDGPFFDGLAWAEEHPDWKDISTWPRHEKEGDILSEESVSKLEDPKNKPGIIGAFCRAYSIEDAIWRYLEDKYIPGENGRYTYVGATGHSGLVIFGDYCYSFHGSDPLSMEVGGKQREYNAFDFVKVHLFGHEGEKEMYRLAEEDEAVMEELEKERGRAAEAFESDGIARPREMFFRRVGKQELFTPKFAAEWYIGMQMVAKMGGELYRYEGGVYVKAAAHFNRFLTCALAEEYRSHYVSETLSYLLGVAEEMKCPFGGDLLNVNNGLLDTTTGELLPHTPLHFSTVRVPWDYNPDAKCPRVDAFFKDYAGDHWELVWYMIGYCLLSTLRFEKQFILYGVGSNGKGTTLELITKLLGDENVSHVAMQKLESNNFMASNLVGKLANIQADLPNKVVESEGVLKTIASGDAIQVERKHQQPFTTRIRAKLMYSTNTYPQTTDNTNGFYRKQCIITYGKKYNDPNRHLLFTEMEGLLAKAIQYAIKLNGMDQFPGDGDVDDYRMQTDTVYGFVKEWCTLVPGNPLPKSKVYSRYQEYCRHEGKGSYSHKKFSQMFKTILGDTVEEQKSKSERRWIGITVEEDQFCM